MTDKIDLKKAKVVYKDTQSAKDYAKIIAEKLSCEFLSINELKNDADLFIVIGGDGTLLKCARYASQYDIPVFGINMGRLGFLSQADLSETETVLDKIRNGEFRIEERMMLKGDSTNIALNDIVIKNTKCTRTSSLELHINQKLVCSYLADGLIVSTPTGSTAYNLSAGGAVIAPEIECMTIVPICAHTLSARPVVVSAEDTIEIKFKTEGAEFKIIADGKISDPDKDSITIKRHEKKAKLLLLNSKHKEFYDILRDKLHWGVAPTK